MTSLWLANRGRAPWVAGAGITGLMTAVLLARTGKSVLVLEARTVGSCATGNTTAKISLLQGTHLSKIIRRHGVQTAKAYIEGNREGREWQIHTCFQAGEITSSSMRVNVSGSDTGLPSASR
jgi:glycine/D-amino acid oxidase-like deaminating enzyme